MLVGQSRPASPVRPLPPTMTSRPPPASQPRIAPSWPVREPAASTSCQTRRSRAPHASTRSGRSSTVRRPIAGGGCPGSAAGRLRTADDLAGRSATTPTTSWPGRGRRTRPSCGRSILPSLATRATSSLRPKAGGWAYRTYVLSRARRAGRPRSRSGSGPGCRRASRSSPVIGGPSFSSGPRSPSRSRPGRGRRAGPGRSSSSGSAARAGRRRPGRAPRATSERRGTASAASERGSR